MLAHRVDPTASRWHRRVVFGVGIGLGILTLAAAFVLRDVALPPDIRDVLPRRSTILAVELRPNDTAPRWASTSFATAIRERVEETFAQNGATIHLDSRQQLVGLAWLQTPTGVALVASCSCASVPAGRTVAGRTFVSADADALASLAPRTGSFRDDPALIDVEPSLPGGEAFEILLQPSLIASSSVVPATGIRDVDALLKALPPLVATWPTLTIRGHLSSDMLAVTAAFPRSVMLENDALTLPRDASAIALTNPGMLLLSRDAISLPWENGSPPLTSEIIGSDRLLVALLPDGGTYVSARRPLGWGVETPAVDALLRWSVRAERTTTRPLPLPDGTIGEESVGPSDAELPVREESGWRVVDDRARARIDGPEVALRFSNAGIPSWDDAEQRILRARFLERDVNPMIARLVAQTPSLTPLTPLLRGAWDALTINTIELDAATTEHATLVRARWR